MCVCVGVSACACVCVSFYSYIKSAMLLLLLLDECFIHFLRQNALAFASESCGGHGLAACVEAWGGARLITTNIVDVDAINDNNNK